MVSATMALAAGLLAVACGSSSDPGDTSAQPSPSGTTTETTTSAPSTTSAPTTSEAIAAGPGADLAALIPTPANSERVDGPEAIHEDGVRKHFLVTGAPLETMDAYKVQLEGDGWAVTVRDSGGGEGGGGATYTGTKGEAFGVFTGGGYDTTTDVRTCVWPAEPTNPACDRI
ncbi:hypothetical protein [Mycolicibacterium sp.]|uniref:hypothetical protein n=1 Tax=Mycolicibacterium sp. TaxID=2320850 RepID=UPI003D0C57F6